MCKFFVKNGKCKFGSTCAFAHNVNELRKSSFSDSGETQNRTADSEEDIQMFKSNRPDPIKNPKNCSNENLNEEHKEDVYMKESPSYNELSPMNLNSPDFNAGEPIAPITQHSQTQQQWSPTKLKITMKNDNKFVQEQFLKANQLLKNGRQDEAYGIIEMLIYKEDIAFEYSSGQVQFPQSVATVQSTLTKNCRVNGQFKLNNQKSSKQGSINSINSTQQVQQNVQNQQTQQDKEMQNHELRIIKELGIEEDD